MTLELHKEREDLLCRKVEIEKQTKLIIPNKRMTHGLPMFLITNPGNNKEYKKGQIIVCNRDSLLNKICIHDKDYYLVFNHSIFATVSLSGDDKIVFDEDKLNFSDKTNKPNTKQSIY